MIEEKTITPENLKSLDVDLLVDLLMEGCDNDPVLAKRVRLILTAEDGADKLSAVIDERIAAIARSCDFVSGNECSTYLRELDDLRDAIVNTLGKIDPAEAVERLWSFFDLFDGVAERLEDDDSDVVFNDALQNLGEVCLAVEDRDEIGLAEKVFEILDVDGLRNLRGFFETMGQALGGDGLAHLKALLATASADAKNGRWVSTALRELADAENDVDAYIAAVVEHPNWTRFEGEVAKRLLAANRAEEALAWLDKPDEHPWREFVDRTDLKIEALEQLERKSEAQAERLARFRKTLSLEHLREHLKRLPDSERIEAEREKPWPMRRRFPTLRPPCRFWRDGPIWKR